VDCSCCAASMQDSAARAVRAHATRTVVVARAVLRQLFVHICSIETPGWFAMDGTMILLVESRTRALLV